MRPHDRTAPTRRRRPGRAAPAPGVEPDATSRWPLAPILVALAALPFAAVSRNEFLNWDDHTAFVANSHLAATGVVHWALTTTLLDHYQPVSWLAWAATVRVAGLAPWAFHTISLAGHALNAALVYWVALRLVPGTVPVRERRGGAAIAALAFAVHPIHVETVAWASALPYVLALAFLLTACLAYFRYCESPSPGARAGWFLISLACYTLSLLSRAYALMFAAVLLCIDRWLLRRPAPVGRLAVEKVPFAMAAAGSLLLEWQARPPDISGVGLAARATLALESPFLYAGRLAMPVWLSPVYPLPIDPAVNWLRLALLVGAAVCAAAGLVHLRRRPGVLCAIVASLLLLSPTLMVQTGLQASADRYMYISAVPLALAAGAYCASALVVRRTFIITVVCVLGAAYGGLVVRQVAFWHDSVALWTRAVTLDPRNDIATYNLASALAAGGRADDAVTWYERTLALIPDHALARANITSLQATRYESEAAAAAIAGRYPAAIEAYTKALKLDPTLRHARASRGMALARTEAWAAAAADLAAARQAGVNDPEVSDSLALALARLGREADAVAVLKDALRVSPDNVTVAHNLARLLLEAADGSIRDPGLAQSIAQEICARTGFRDARALETLAGAYAAGGSRELAAQTAARGVAAARQSGDLEATRALEALLGKLGH
jgi:tetratricopeptide (TPR) repeat protein